jgi:uncharacterized protein YqeY
MSANLKTTIQDAVKAAMKARDKDKLAILRLISADIKQQEVNQRIDLSDAQVIEVLTKMVKQRKESVLQFQQAARDDLVAKENFEISIINTFLPEQLSKEQVAKLIEQEISASSASSIRDMSKVMQNLRKSLVGVADLNEVAKLVKERLS